jgi:DNA-binding CsgD family transcriptional regulator
MVLLAQGAVLYCEDEWERALVVHEAAMRRDFGPGETTRQWVLRQWHSELLAELDRLPESMELISDGIEAAQRQRQRWAVDFLEIWRGRQLLQSGRLADAAATLEGRFGPDREQQVVGSLYAAAAVALTRVAIHTGKRGIAAPALALAREMLARGTPSTARQGAWILALAAMADGRPQQALAEVREGEARAGGRSLLPLFPFDPAAAVELVRISLAAGDPARARATAVAARRRAARLPGVRGLAGVAAHAEGLIADDPAALEAAGVHFDASLHPLALASCWEDLGSLRFTRGQRGSAIDAWDRALTLWTGCGAGWDAARVRRRLRAAGIRRRSSPGDRPTSGWDALTPSEMTVVTLVAEAHTNREVAERLFVSPHTVNSHLRAAFAKLGISTRVELARRFAEWQAAR